MKTFVFTPYMTLVVLVIFLLIVAAAISGIKMIDLGLELSLNFPVLAELINEAGEG